MIAPGGRVKWTMGVVIAFCHNCDQRVTPHTGHSENVLSVSVSSVTFVFWTRNVKVQLVIIMGGRRRDEAAGMGPYGLEVMLCLNFDPAQGEFHGRLLRLSLQGPIIAWAPSKALKLTLKIPY